MTMLPPPVMDTPSIPGLLVLRPSSFGRFTTADPFGNLTLPVMTIAVDGTAPIQDLLPNLDWASSRWLKISQRISMIRYIITGSYRKTIAIADQMPV